MKKFYSILGSVLMFVGAATLAPASVWVFIYQPKIPKCLVK